MPGDIYTELILPTRGVYEFFFPNTAAGEHYQRPGDPDRRMPRSSEPGVTEQAITITTRILSAAPIASIDSPSHRLKVARLGAGEALATIDEGDTRAAARDFVLRYSMTGDDIGTGVIAFEGGEENFFLLTAQPPKTIAPARIPPREYIFVVDVSGSMHGRPLDVSKQLVRDLFQGLRPGDMFNMVFFAGGSNVLAESGSLPATPETLELALQMLADARAGGGTELQLALEKAYGLPTSPGHARTVLVITDGVISAGGSVSRFVSSRLDTTSLFVFGIGESVDRSVIERIARAGEGEPFIVDDMGKAEAEAGRLREYIEKPVLTGIGLRWAGSDLYDLEPAKIPDLFAERPIVVVGKYRGPLAGNVVITGRAGAREVSIPVDLGTAYRDPGLSSLAKLWARRRIDRIEDMGCGDLPACDDSGPNGLRESITGLGLKYGLLTQYTSFVAVTEQVRTRQPGVTVDQPAAARETSDEQASPAALGYGFSAGVAGLAGLVAPSAMPAITGPGRQVAGHEMLATAEGWVDKAHRPTARVLRIRRDSAAYALLLRLAPGLADLLALPGRVLLAFGDYSIQITPEGFSDYPEGTLRKALGLAPAADESVRVEPLR